MPKETMINLSAQTQSQETFIVDVHQDATYIFDKGYTKEDFEKAPSKNARPLRSQDGEGKSETTV